MAVDYSIVGKRIKLARTKKNYTQEHLAEKLNVSVTFLSRIECGSSRINLKRLSQLCEILNISESELLNGTAIESKTYLTNDFSNLLKNCPPEKMKLIYNIAELIINNSKTKG